MNFDRVVGTSLSASTIYRFLPVEHEELVVKGGDGDNGDEQIKGGYENGCIAAIDA